MDNILSMGGAKSIVSVSGFRQRPGIGPLVCPGRIQVWQLSSERPQKLIHPWFFSGKGFGIDIFLVRCALYNSKHNNHNKSLKSYQPYPYAFTRFKWLTDVAYSICNFNIITIFFPRPLFFLKGRAFWIFIKVLSPRCTTRGRSSIICKSDKPQTKQKREITWRCPRKWLYI